MQQLARKAYRRIRPRPAIDTPALPLDELEPDFEQIRETASAFTMTSRERMYALWQSVGYVHRAGIDGAFVEAGVWRGGSSLVAALTLDALGDRRPLWLYDTFEGMPPPSEHDVDLSGEVAEQILADTPREAGENNEWAYATLDDVKQTMGHAQPREIRYVEGKVEDTIPAQAPSRIALLRLDTDWYESTRHELEHLFPRLAPGGVLIIDDYGHWQGARKAVDEYFSGRPEMLTRIDYTSRLAIKREDA